MTDLSPAAQSVINAAVEAGGGYGRATPVLHARIAASLRAVADQICMKQPLGSTDADAGVFAAHHAISTSLLAIADELEAQ
jgi:hypothetical protein